MKEYLTKADFLRFHKCPRAAYYGWKGYASKSDEDPFLQFLSQEGRKVEAAARRLFRKPIVVGEADPWRAHRETRAHLGRNNITLLEPCIIVDRFIVRPDVLIKRGKELFLIEVKSKVGDLRAHRAGRMLFNTYGAIRAAWREYVFDLAFQTEVIRRAFPDLKIVPYLLLPEASAVAHPSELGDIARATTADDDEDVIRDRRQVSVLKFFCAREAVEAASGLTSGAMDQMALVRMSGKIPDAPLVYPCRNCEFRLGRGDDGWSQCWGNLAKPRPHLFDLYQLYSLRTDGNTLFANERIKEGRTSLFDVTADELHGKHAARQRIQLTYQRDGKEWVDPRLREEIIGLNWPVIFLDFETTIGAIPWYAGVRPYEVMPFQFSAHILNKNGQVEHKEWLNMADQPPILDFIRELAQAVGKTGSILVYTDYENRILIEACNYLKREVAKSQAEQAWITDLLNSNRIVDQHDWILKWYFHPMMSGKTSIKKVLPAIWHENAALRHSPHFEKYFDLNADGVVLDPYETLPSAEIAGAQYSVREGCAAMQVYREMIRGIGSSDPCAKATLAALLREYVTLDTASQWIIFEHWRQRLGIRNSLINSAEITPLGQKNDLNQ